MKGYLILAAAACLCGVIIVVLKNSRAAQKFALGAIGGLAALAAVDLSAAFTGVGLGINAFTLLCSAVLGLPGVTAMLFLRLMF